MITGVFLRFTPADGGEEIVGIAIDPDGDGPLDIDVGGVISLETGISYTLQIEIENSLDGTDIGEEVRQEGTEHQFFFQWTDDLFTDPAGNGNVDNSTDPVNYLDQDENGLPLGLTTSWITSASSSGFLQIVLKHQPGIKSSSSGVNTGDTDINLTWNIEVN